MLDDTTKAVVDEVVALATQPGTPEPVERPRHTLEAIALFDRCRGLFGAVRLLVQHGFAHEALILTRPMYVESLMLLELASVGETRRVELIIGWSLATLADLEGVWTEAERGGEDISEQRAASAKQRASLEGYARRHDAGTQHWNVNVKALADKHRDGDGYLDYRMAHHFVHGSTFAGQQRYALRGDTVIIGDPTESQQAWGRGVVLSASESMLYAIRGLCGIVGWHEPPALADLLERVNQLAQPPDTSD